MDDCIVALERDLGHDPEAFRLAVEMLRREVWGGEEETIATNAFVGTASATADSLSHVSAYGTASPSASRAKTVPKLTSSCAGAAIARRASSPSSAGSHRANSRARSPSASIRGASSSAAVTPQNHGRQPNSPARHTPSTTASPYAAPPQVKHYAPTIDLDRLLVPPNALQTTVVQHFVAGRSLAVFAGRRSGRAVLATMLAQLASDRLDGFSYTSARTAIVCSDACLDRLLAGPLAFMVRNGEVLLDSSSRLEVEPWTVEALAGVGVLVVVGNTAELSLNVLDGVLARLQTAPQTVALVDKHAPDMFVRDSDLAETVTWAVGHPGSAADVPLHVVRHGHRLRAVFHESGGRANLALRVRREEDKLGALKRLVQDMFDSVAIVVVCQSFRKAERLADALNHFTPGVRSLAAIHRDPLEFGDATKELIDTVLSRDSLRASDEWKWTPRLVVVTDAPSLRRISHLERMCAVVFFDVPPPATTTNACPVLHCKTTLFPEVPLTVVLTAGPAEAKAISSGAGGWIDVHH